MPQLSTTQKDTESPQASSKKAPAGKGSTGSKAENQKLSQGQREWTKLGYEVFNKRRAPFVQVPLSVSATVGSSSYTGSALLDSFVRDRTIESPALKTLRLVNVADSVADSGVTSPAFKAEPAQVSAHKFSEQKATVIQAFQEIEAEASAEKASIEKALAEEAVKKELSEETPEQAQLATVSQEEFLAEQTPTTVVEDDETSERVEIKALLVEIPEPEIPEPEIQEPEAQQPEIQEPEIQEPEISRLVTDAQKASDGLDATSDGLDATLDQPPTEAEPDQLDEAPASPRLTSVQPKQSSPRRLPVPADNPGFSASVNHEKRARDCAATVGLIDISDTLLFGGDRPDLISADPFIPLGGESHLPGVLAYLTKQISAFTVDRLQNGFPHNTDPRVLNRLDPPKRKTVLDAESFKLGDLTNLEPELKAKTRKGLVGQSHRPSQDAAEISVLSQQVEDLNRKIAYLSQKLAQVADTAE